MPSDYTKLQEFSAGEQIEDYCFVQVAQHEGILPLPPQDLRLYGESDADHMSGGSYDHDHIVNGLAAAGVTLSSLKRILEFGCSNGRVLRHFVPEARRGGTELWGVDIDARRASWTHHNFAPDANVAITTPIPHLPFGDRYFDFVYAISIFTHIDLTFMSWFAEIARVIAPGGMAWLTIHDEASIRIMNSDTSNYFINQMKAETEFSRFKDQPFDWFGVGKGVMRNVFFRRAWIVDRLSVFFSLKGAFEGVTGSYQTALLLQRK